MSFEEKFPSLKKWAIPYRDYDFKSLKKDLRIIAIEDIENKCIDKSWLLEQIKERIDNYKKAGKHFIGHWEALEELRLSLLEEKSED